MHWSIINYENVNIKLDFELTFGTDIQTICKKLQPKVHVLLEHQNI